MNQKSITMLILMFTTLTASLCAQEQSTVDQNSNEKIRVVPNALASKIGSAISWESKFEDAAKKSAESNKPIFWYVPQLTDTFMDRKAEIDRYMRAGPFSNPHIIASLNEHYVPLLAIPEEDQAKQYELKPFLFIEPGFLIIEPSKAVSTKLDRITTMNQKWLSSFLKAPTELPEPGRSLRSARQHFAAAEYEKCHAAGSELISEDDQVELQLISAMATFRSGQHKAALKKFAVVAESFPQHPLGWKAAAESQRIGPFVRGFETFRDLPDDAMEAGRKSKGSAAPANTYSEAQLWKRGVEYLLTMQNDEGCFDDSDYDFGGTDGLPNVHVAVTSIAAMALLEAADRDDLKELRPRIFNAIDKAVKYVNDPTHLNLRDRDEIFWAYMYRLKLMNRLAAKGNAGGIEAVQLSVDALVGVQAPSGDWYHEYNNPFVTANALWAMKEAKSLGARVEESAVATGLAALKRCRFRGGAWTYNSPEDKSANHTPESRNSDISSGGRRPLCEGALVIWDQATNKSLVNSLQKAFELHPPLDAARKYDDHTSSYSYGGFFYWYDMSSRTEAILKVNNQATRKKMGQRQRELILAIPEIDGCFVDSHEIGRSYGTAMALLCLSGCQQAIQDAPEN